MYPGAVICDLIYYNFHVLSYSVIYLVNEVFGTDLMIKPSPTIK